MEYSQKTGRTPRFQRACAYLFSPDHARNPDFLKNLDPQMLKQAFRKKAKQYHPDLHGREAAEMRLRRRERFVRIKESYEYLSLKIQDEPPPARHVSQKPPEKRPLIIAIGGAKGGIGKSLFTANLAIYLSKSGYRTVAADLDLGGANLHLYLGKTRLKKSVNDFLKQKAETLAQVLEPTAYGPSLIGGDSSFLGAGNIGFARKLKLMKAIRKMDADLVVVDLGGDTAFNVLDFFLSADVGVVMTTCDPASYLDAYAFIKVALYRKLNRIFGPESFYSGPVDPVLRRLIQQATRAVDNSVIPSISQLRQEVRDKTRSGLRLLDQVLKQFTPFVIVNKTDDSSSAMPPVQRIQKVCSKSLSIEVPYLGSLPFESGIEASARTLVPFLTTPEAAPYTRRLKAITEQILSC